MNLKKTTGLLILFVLTASCRQESLPSAPSSERTGRAVIEATLEDQISRIGIAEHDYEGRAITRAREEFFLGCC